MEKTPGVEKEPVAYLETFLSRIENNKDLRQADKAQYLSASYRVVGAGIDPALSHLLGLNPAFVEMVLSEIAESCTRPDITRYADALQLDLPYVSGERWNRPIASCKP